MSTWFVYVLECADGTYYTGITTDVTRRVTEHNSGRAGKGARYTAARLPVSLVHYEAAPDRSTASQREYALKQLSRAQKKSLLQGQ
jgi:putative endonuclease